jgi:pyruvate dehydrogenase E2 component (dihydrolipoamide acetyltransferase)
MAKAVIMPRQGQSVESCILTRWFKQVGDPVSQGDLLFAYETDKAAFEEESKEEGVLLAQFFQAGEEVPVLAPVAVIGKAGEAVEGFSPVIGTQAGSTEGVAAVTASGTAASIPGGSPEPLPGQAERAAVSPRARKRALEKRVVLDSVKGTGPGGRIIERDVLEEVRMGKRLTPLARRKLEESGLAVPGEGRAPFGKITSKDLVEWPPPHVLPTGKGDGGYRDIPLSNIRKIVAEAMYRSLQNSAQLTHHLSANAARMLRLRNEVKKRMKDGYPYNITLNDMVCFSAVRALKSFPEANAHLLEGILRQFGSVNLGLAVDTERGLLVPALPGADEYSLPALSEHLARLAEAARTGSVSPDLLSPGAASFTISNLGNYGVEMFTPVINLPQVAILGVNTIIQRPAVLDDGTYGFQPFIGLSLTYDHRAIDGGPATRFLAEIRNQIERLSEDLL